MITDAEINAVLVRVDSLLDEVFPYRERQATLVVKPVAAVVAAPVVKRDDDQGLCVKSAVSPATRPPASAVVLPHAMARRAVIAAMQDEIAF